MSAPLEFRVSGQKIVQAEAHDLADGDPRGIVWLYESPKPNARYVIGVDATNGRTGWNRYARTDNDQSIDNGAIEVIRLGRGEPGGLNYVPDMQVAEYAAPIDPYDLAKVVNILGRLYSGNADDGQALCIIEVYPGPGGPCQRTLMEKYGYTNLYRWQYLDTGQTSSRSQFDFGWYSTKQSMQHLWTRGLRFLHRKQVMLRSPFLVEELADCQMDTTKNRGAAASGFHDDRVTALLLAIWAGHNYTFHVEPRATRVESGSPNSDWQSTDVSTDRMSSLWEERWSELSQLAEDI